MTILFYKDNEMSPTIGGISKINCTLRDSLIKRGYNCIFLSSTYNKNIVADATQLWLPDLNCESSGDNLRWLKSYIVDNKVDVIINNCFKKKSVRFLSEAREGTPCRLFTWIHNNIVEYGSLIGYRKENELRNSHFIFIYRLLINKTVIRLLRHLSKIKHQGTARECYRKSDGIITVCQGNNKEFAFLLGHKDSGTKIFSIPNFVTGLSTSNKMLKKKNSVVWCGTIDNNLKKTNWMIDIWGKVQSIHPDWSLTIMGDSPYLDDIKEYTKNKGVNRVVFTGRVSPEEYYEDAAIICSTSITESFGLTIIEGMQRGVVPIAFSYSVALREVIGDNGILVEPYDLDRYAQELASLMSNNTRLEYLSKKCIEASAKYREEVVVSQWIDCLNKLERNK